MSGGSFNYAYTKVDQFADELCVRIYGDTPDDFEQETFNKLIEILKLARYAAKMMKEVEWLYSGETSDDSFMKRIRDIEGTHIPLNFNG